MRYTSWVSFVHFIGLFCRSYRGIYTCVGGKTYLEMSRALMSPISPTKEPYEIHKRALWNPQKRPMMYISYFVRYEQLISVGLFCRIYGPLLNVILASFAVMLRLWIQSYFCCWHRSRLWIPLGSWLIRRSCRPLLRHIGLFCVM